MPNREKGGETAPTTAPLPELVWDPRLLASLRAARDRNVAVQRAHTYDV